MNGTCRYAPGKQRVFTAAESGGYGCKQCRKEVVNLGIETITGIDGLGCVIRIKCRGFGGNVVVWRV